MGRSFRNVVLLMLAASFSRADDIAADIARIHIDAIGGPVRVERLEGFRAAGQSRVGDFTMDFQMWAKRPSSIRIEVMMQNQTLLQGWDGENSPWIQGGVNGAPQEMPPDLATRFKIESAFDTPLFNPEERGFVLEYAGEDQVRDRPVVKLLATRNITDQCTLYLAADTYFIVQQDRVRYEPGGSRVLVETQYGGFRPVLGVIMPHRIVVMEEGEVVSDVMLNWMEPNPPIEDAEFQMPVLGTE